MGATRPSGPRASARSAPTLNSPWKWGGRTTAPTSPTRSPGAAGFDAPPYPTPELTRSLRPSPSCLGDAAAGRERRALERGGGRRQQSGRCPPLPPGLHSHPALEHVRPPAPAMRRSGRAHPTAAAQPSPAPRAPPAPFRAVPGPLAAPLRLALPGFTWHCTGRCGYLSNGEEQRAPAATAVSIYTSRTRRGGVGARAPPPAC